MNAGKKRTALERAVKEEREAANPWGRSSGVLSKCPAFKTRRWKRRIEKRDEHGKAAGSGTCL